METKIFSIHWNEDKSYVLPEEKINKFIAQNNVKENHRLEVGPYNTMLYYEEL